MFEKKYKIGKREKILIENILIKEITKLEDKQKSYTILIHHINHPKHTNLRLMETKEELSKMQYLINYLRDLE